MGHGKAGGRTGRLIRNTSGQDGLFEKSGEEEREVRRDEPVECLGLTFDNDDLRQVHFLGKLSEGLEELHAKLGGVPYAGVEDAAARMAAIECWPMGDKTRLRELAQHMRHAESSKDLLQRWKDEVGFPHGEIDDILKLSDPPYFTACPNPFLGAFVEVHGKLYDPGRAIPTQTLRSRCERGQDPCRLPCARLPHQGAASGDCPLDSPLHRARRSGSGRLRRLRHDRRRCPMVRYRAGKLQTRRSKL